jgi:DNA-binding FadR family transcriptional regulator
MSPFPLTSDFLRYLATHSAAAADQAEDVQLPSLKDLSSELGVSVAGLREQLEVARAIGLVEVRPRTGIRRLPYTFLPAVRQSLSYAVTLDMEHFFAFADLRTHIEVAYLEEAARLLTPADHASLHTLVTQAWEKLQGSPVRIPHQEHKQLHLGIYSRLGNPFVHGLLQAYWEAYEAVGLNLYADYTYLTQVWEYHQRMVEAICAGDFTAARQALVEHRDLLYRRTDTTSAKHK